MRASAGISIAVLLAANLACGAQTTGAANSAPATGGTPSSPAAGAGQPAAPDTRTEKQKALARQTERLFDMATELKVQVDKTNKNILSLKVVEKAEEIELLAKGLKEQAKK